jgi:hypothetical protein
MKEAAMAGTTTKATGLALCTVLAAGGVASCGSSGSGAAVATGTLTVSQFKVRANAICKAGNADIKQIGSSITASSSPNLIVVALHEAADRANREVSDIRRLNAPPSIAPAVTSMLDSVNAATAKILKGGLEVLSGPNPFADADAKAKALGLNDCVSSSSA